MNGSQEELLLRELIDSLDRARTQIQRIADRLDSWDQVYIPRTDAPGGANNPPVHQLREISTVFVKDRA